MSDVRKLRWFGLIAGIGTLLLAGHDAAAQASTVVSADGAVSVNASYESGKSSTYYIELQRDGTPLILQGIATENDAMIRQGLLQLDWGFNHQGADGSFPGTGDPFHSTSLFVESAARSTMALQNYHPISYTLDASYYNAHIARYIAGLHQAGLWLITPSVAATGQAGDFPYTHRRYILAAALGEIGALTGDSNISAAALPYAQAGIARQITSGTSNTVVTFPNGVTQAVSMVGVNPEVGGYDVNYQAAGLEMAGFYYPYCTDPGTKAQLASMLAAGLNWEYPWLGTNGVITYTGSTRVGVEQNRDGSLKQPDYTDIQNAFINGANILGQQAAETAAIRIQEGGCVATAGTVGADGAVDANLTWEQTGAGSWSISNQKNGVAVLEAGIQREDPSLIQEGCNIIDWGYAHQLADGSFGTTSAPFSGVSTFVETTARAASLLAAYTPSIYGSAGQEAFYQSEVAKWTADGAAATSWLTQPTVWNTGSGYKDVLTSPQHLFCLGAMLTEQGALSNNPTWQNTGLACTSAGLALQTVSGTYPEKGVVTFNPQMYSTNYVERIAATLPKNSPMYPVLMSSIASSVAWTTPYVNASGAVTGVSGPDKLAVQATFGLADELAPSQAETLVATRMNWMKTNNTLAP